MDRAVPRFVGSGHPDHGLRQTNFFHKPIYFLELECLRSKLSPLPSLFYVVYIT